MGLLNPKAQRLIGSIDPISNEGKRNLIGLLSLMVEILNPVDNDESNGIQACTPKKRKTRMSVNATKAAERQQAGYKVTTKDAIILALLLVGYILGNTIAPTEWTERGTSDPALTGPIIWINE